MTGVMRTDTDRRVSDTARSTDAGDYQRTPHPAAVLAKSFADGETIAAHAHRRHQLVWASRGVMRVETADGAWIVPTNRALWIPAGEVHALRMAGTVDMRTLYLEPGSAAVPERPKLVSASALLRALLLDAAGWPLDRQDRRAALVTELILDELATLDAAPLYLPTPSDLRLKRVCDGLLADPGSPWTIEQWAWHVGASARTVARLFERETGMRFRDWRQQARLAVALVELARGTPVSRLARDLGYRNPSAFTVAFRKAMGTAPASTRSASHETT